MSTSATDEPQTEVAPPRDTELLRLYVEQRSEPAFAALSRRYARLVYATCLRETRDTSLAEDAAQGVFLLLSQKAPGLRRVDTLAGWLYIASRHLSRNLLKQERRRRMNEARALEEAIPPPDPGNPLWEQIEPHFHAALDCLKPADRAAILLRYVQNESLADVGVCLGIPENTARMRINRAMEKIRAYLAQVGIAVSLVLLVTLLEEQAAQAVPSSLLATLNASPQTAPTPGAFHAVRWTSRILLLLSLRFPLLLLITACLLFGGAAVYHNLASSPLSPIEQRRLFTRLRGPWTGTLEFADDRTHQRFTLPTTVICTSLNQNNTLRFVATYRGSDREDITTLSGDPRTGVFTADNGGPRSSHILHSTGRLVQLAPGDYAFRGSGFGQFAETRLHITLHPDQIILAEEYRKVGQSDYQFRNRFILHHAPP